MDSRNWDAANRDAGGEMVKDAAGCSFLLQRYETT